MPLLAWTQRIRYWRGFDETETFFDERNFVHLVPRASMMNLATAICVPSLGRAVAF
jgi:hypothetical protein